jgi:hypothetical protein|tara:strand:+ start:1392 stop:1811 length:420 start_codon:yes stop_codon:yes gene_type:complete
MPNSRNKGASFERMIATSLSEELGLNVKLKRILEQTREKYLPDLIFGDWYLECKRYASGKEPATAWWQQVIDASKDRGTPTLIYKFDRQPIKVRIPLHAINNNLPVNNLITCDLNWNDFIYLIKSLYPDDIKNYNKQAA